MPNSNHFHPQQRFTGYSGYNSQCALILTLTVLRKEVSSAPPSSSAMMRPAECHASVTNCHADPSSSLSHRHRFTDSASGLGWPAWLVTAALLCIWYSLSVRTLTFPSPTSACHSFPHSEMPTTAAGYQSVFLAAIRFVQNCNAKITGGSWHLWL